ncbi:MAG: class I SAM-dependent methyltransferase, partial [Alphaproteobacteria bacterium]
LRNDSPVRRLEGLDTVVETARGACGGPVELREGEIRFLADLAGGQKTGWFYDQRDNRAFTGNLARDGRVLDVYCHTGGFALHAAAGGAREVLGVDRSAAALALAEQAAALNGFGACCRFLKADAFTALERLGRDGERFDLVVADPPAFVKSRKDIKPGLRAYRKLARLCAGLVSPGGFLFIASCSHNVAGDSLAEQVGRGLADAHRGGRILRRAGAGPDHPVHPWLPESAYLKSLVLQLD